MHNQYACELTQDENNPLVVSNLKPVATTLEDGDVSGNPMTRTEWLCETEHVDFYMSAPMGFPRNDGVAFEFAVGEIAELSATLELGELMGGDEIAYSVYDPGSG